MPAGVRAQLEKILASELFARSERLSQFLRFTVEQALDGKGESLKEYTIGVEVFDKDHSFDPRIDTIVRVQARRLRAALTEYYAEQGKDDRSDCLPERRLCAGVREPGSVSGSARTPSETSIRSAGGGHGRLHGDRGTGRSLESAKTKSSSGADHVCRCACVQRSEPGQDPFDRRAERARSSFDRPQRLTANGVYELPFWREQKGSTGKVLRGWQISAFLTLQSGAPFTALSGGDPGNRLGGLANTVRAHLNTNLDLARMPVEQMLRAGGAGLFRRATAASPLGDLGRNILRSDGIANLDLGLLKNTRVGESHNLQFRVEFYNTFNSRDFGIPDGNVTSASFLNQWGANGGNRRIVVAVRYIF